MDTNAALQVITTALVLGAQTGATSVAGDVIKDGYAALKALIVRKFGDKGDTAQAIEAVEKKPDSDGRKTTLKEELATAGADRDQEIVDKATDLLKLLERGSPGATGGLVGQINAAGGKVLVIGKNDGFINM